MKRQCEFCFPKEVTVEENGLKVKRLIHDNMSPHPPVMPLSSKVSQGYLKLESSKE